MEKFRPMDFERFRRFIEIDKASLIPLLGGNPANIDPKRELMITDLSVVNDPARTFDVCSNAGTPMGIWTFGHLMSEMANQPITGIDPSGLYPTEMGGFSNLSRAGQNSQTASSTSPRHPFGCSRS